MKIGFFRALYGSCAGIAVFDQLRNHSFARAAWHLLCMSVLSAAIIGVGVFPGVKRSLHNSMSVFVENCGSVVCSANGITPELEPEKARSFVVSGPMAITYLPDKSTALPKDFTRGCDRGILWSADGKILLWSLLADEKFAAVSLSDPLAALEPQAVWGKTDLFKALMQTPALKLKLKPSENEILTPAKLQALTDLAVNLGVGGILLRKTLLEVIIYIAMFAVVTLIMNMNRPHRMPFRELMVLAVYAGFPPMLIGSLAEALQLPYLSFNMIYVLGMTFYLIVIMNRLERLRQEKQWREEGQ